MTLPKDIIFFSLSRYDDAISFVGYSFARELAKNNRVFYIERPFTFKDRLKIKDPSIAQRKAVWKGAAPYLEVPDQQANFYYITPPLMMSVNGLPPGKLYDHLSDKNDGRLMELIRKIIREHGVKSFIFINCFNPFYIRKFPPDIKPQLNLYYCVDDISQVEYTRKHGLKRENEIIAGSDGVFVTSMELLRLKKVLNKHAYYLPNASDYNLFSKAAEHGFAMPAEMQSIKNRKIVGFTGSIEYRTDFELVDKMIRHHQDKFFVFIGPVICNDVKERGLDKMPNVLFTGARKLSELPAYLQYMDVMIIPYKLSVVTKSIYPLKLNEYLGAGKPTVSTVFSADIESFGDVVYLGRDHDEFIRLIDVAINEETEEKRTLRMETAKRNTWEARVRQFWDQLGEKSQVI